MTILCHWFSFRYTSLVRRNFLRFGKRSGGDTIDIPEEEGTEEMEENEKLNKFINFFQHFNAVRVQQEIPEEIEDDLNVIIIKQYSVLNASMISGLSRLFEGEKSAEYYQIWKKSSRGWE